MPSPKMMERQICSQNQVGNLLISAAAGSVLGATAALLLAPKSGERLRRDLTNTYHDLSDKTQDLAGNIKDTASQFISQPEKSSNLLIGALGGAIIAAAAVMLLNNKDEDEAHINGFADKIKEVSKNAAKNINSINWIETAKDLVNEISEKVQVHNGTNIKKKVECAEDKINEAINWAALGFRVWQNMKKRR